MTYQYILTASSNDNNNIIKSCILCLKIGEYIDSEVGPTKQQNGSRVSSPRYRAIVLWNVFVINMAPHC